jgi:predicted  nucleic acid-binding Zn-ribbon protein
MPNTENNASAAAGPPDPAADRLREVNERLTLAMLRVQEQAEELERVVRALKASEADLHTKNNELEKFHDMVVGRELRIMELEKEVTRLQAKIDLLTSKETAR